MSTRILFSALDGNKKKLGITYAKIILLFTSMVNYIIYLVIVEYYMYIHLQPKCITQKELTIVNKTYTL